ncbi:MAG TPA: TonB-dependent receptor [Terriglobales bacterium]|nr:TonB-dependent receptor [Terriglobales bacterium]
MKLASRALFLFLFLCAVTFAQTYQGRILGTVTDSSGAVVAGAKVTITNPDTGLTRSLTTTDAGDYVAPALPPGNYQVTVEAPNFKRYEQKGIRLEVAKDVRIDAKLTAGGASESVTVTSDAPLVETTNNTLGGTFSNKSINELPLNGRDFQNLVVLRPGVQRAPGGGFLSISSNGNRPEDNNFIVDGTDNNDPYYATTVINAEGVQGTPGTVLPIDAIQEFNAQENPPAEYGWKPGAIVNLGLKSGTNDLHGTAYLFERNNAFDARNWTNPVIDPDTGLHSEQRALRQHQFGGSIGGPIIKNRTFFFGAYEGVRALVSNSNSVTTPSTVTAGGDPFVSIPDAIADLAAHGIAVNPLSANLIGQGTFQGNGGFPGLFAVNTTGTDKINVGFPNTNRMDNFIVKVDHRINDRNQITGRYFMGDSLQKEQDVTVTRAQWLSKSDLNAQVGGLNWVWTPNARWTNEAKVGWNRFWQVIATADDGVNPTDYGINTGVVDPVNFGIPTIRIDGFNNPTLGGNRSWPLYTTPNETLQFADNISWSRGEHTFRFGGEFRHGATDNLRDRSGKGRIRFRDDSPSHPGVFANASALENFLAGVTDTADIFVGNSRRHVTIKSFAAFLQDDWKVRPNLTFFLGVRYELNTRIKEEKNLLGNFDPAIGLQQIGVNISQPYNRDGNNFAPRLGFSWDPWNQGKTVLRGGFGVTYEQPHLAVFLGQNGADNATTPGLNVIPTGAVGSNIKGSIVSQATNLDASGINWSTSGIVFPGLASPPDCSSSPCDILGVKNNLVTPYVMTWNINLQQQLTNSTSMTVAYVGNRGKKLYSIRNINQVDANSPAEIACGHCEFDGRPFATKYPFLNVVNFLENNYSSKYNGLQVSVNQRAWKGHTFVVGYTWSHSADQASLNRMLNPQNSLRQDLEWGDSDLDIRHRLTFTHTWDLPGREGFGQLLKGWQINNIVTLQGGTPWNVVDGFINGNDISGTAEFADRWNFFGDPSAFKPLRRGEPIPFFDYQPDPLTGIIHSNPVCDSHADPGQLSAFGCYAVGNNVLVPPDAFTFGNMRRNLFRNPGLYNWDFSLVKAFQATERLNIQLRAEFFNVLNRAHLAPANASVFGFIDPSDPSTFGCNCSTPDVGAANPVIGTGGPRNIQLGLKFRF